MADQNNGNITPHNPLEGDRPELTFNLQDDGSDEQISIVVVHKDRPEYLNLTLQSIAVCSPNNNYEIIVVDNASGQDSQDFLNDIEGDVKVVRLPNNVYFSEAANKGFAATNKHSKYIIFMHSDVVIQHPGWLDLLINVSESQNSGMVGVSSNNYQMGSQKMDFIEEWLVLMTRESFDDIGPWPEELPAVGNAFIMTLRAQYKNHKPQIMKNNIAHHYKIFSLNINDWERLTEQATITLPKLLQEAQTRSIKK